MIIPQNKQTSAMGLARAAIKVILTTTRPARRKRRVHRAARLAGLSCQEGAIRETDIEEEALRSLLRTPRACFSAHIRRPQIKQHFNAPELCPARSTASRSFAQQYSFVSFFFSFTNVNLSDVKCILPRESPRPVFFALHS